MHFLSYFVLFVAVTHCSLLKIAKNVLFMMMYEDLLKHSLIKM